MLSAHVHGTGELAYPEQDPRDLRAQSVRDAFDRLNKAFVRYRLASERYHAQVRNPATNGHPNYKPVSDALSHWTRLRYDMEGVVLQALEEAEVPAIHDRDDSHA